jgi:hypothetical protein
MVELIEREAPAIMYCHWPGLYTHGTKDGFRDFQQVVRALAGRFGDETLWMKLSEIARYQAARELTTIVRQGDEVTLDAPFACASFTLQVATPATAPPRVGGRPLAEARTRSALAAGGFLREAGAVTVCLDLPKGRTVLAV